MKLVSISVIFAFPITDISWASSDRLLRPPGICNPVGQKEQDIGRLKVALRVFLTTGENSKSEISFQRDGLNPSGIIHCTIEGRAYEALVEGDEILSIEPRSLPDDLSDELLKRLNALSSSKINEITHIAKSYYNVVICHQPAVGRDPEMLACDVLKHAETLGCEPELFLYAVLVLMQQTHYTDVYVDALKAVTEGRHWQIVDTSDLDRRIASLHGMGRATQIDIALVRLNILGHGVLAGHSQEKEAREEEDLREAARLVNGYVASGAAIDEATLKALHAIISRHLDIGSKGAYRNSGVKRDGLTYPNPHKLEPAMREFFAWLRREEELIASGSPKAFHPVELAASAFYTFINIHPFENGNTRTGCLLMNSILMRHGFKPFMMDKSNEREFFIIERFTPSPERVEKMEGLGCFVSHPEEYFIDGMAGDIAARDRMRDRARPFTAFLVRELSKESRRDDRRRQSASGIAGQSQNNGIVIGVSVGGTKIGAQGLDAKGDTAASCAKIFWRRKKGEITSNEVLTDILLQIDRIVEGLVRGGISPDRILKVGVSFPGPLDAEKGVVGTPFPSLNLPFGKDYQLKAGLEKLLEVEYKRHIDVEIEDDCVAAIRGELSSRGALSNLSAGTVVIIGTGGNIGVAKDGDVYFGGREEIREMFQNIIGKFDEAAQRWVWTYTGGFTGKLPRLKEGEKYLEDRISGPNLDRRFAEFGYALESDDGSKKNITEAALGGDEKAKELIVEVGRELGRALAVFFAAYKEEDFVKNTVLVGGVSENLGKGVLDGQGRDLFIGAVQDGVLEGLADLGMKDKDRGLAEEIAKRVVRSKQSYEREFMPFVPLEAARLKVGKVHYAGLNLLEELKALKYKDDETRWSIPINIDTLPGDGEEGIKVLESFLEVLALKQLYLNKRYGGRIRFEFVKIGQDGALEGVTNHRICEIYNGILGRSGFWIGKKKDGCVRSFLITDRAHFPESYGETKVLALEEEMEIEDDSNLCLWNGVLDIAIAQTRLSQESTEIRALYYGRLNKLYKMLGRDLEPDQFTALLEKDIQAAISVARDLAIPPCRRFDMEGLQTLYERMRSLMEQA